MEVHNQDYWNNFFKELPRTFESILRDLLFLFDIAHIRAKRLFFPVSFKDYQGLFVNIFLFKIFSRIIPNFKGYET